VKKIFLTHTFFLKKFAQSNTEQNLMQILNFLKKIFVVIPEACSYDSRKLIPKIELA